jgi:hypothetical protein
LCLTAALLDFVFCKRKEESLALFNDHQFYFSALVQRSRSNPCISPSSSSTTVGSKKPFW